MMEKEEGKLYECEFSFFLYFTDAVLIKDKFAIGLNIYLFIIFCLI